MSVVHERVGARGGLGWAEIVPIVLAALYVFLAAPAPQSGDTAYSRLGTVYALVHHGTFYLDRPLGEAPNPFESATVDKAMAKGRIISTKPPVLPLAMTGEYLLLRVFGYDLEVVEHRAAIARIMAITFSWTSFVIVLLALAGILRRLEVPLLGRLMALLVAGFSSQIAGYAMCINNHLPGAAAMMVALYLVVRIWTSVRPSPLSFLGFGLCAGLTFAIDLPLTIFPALAGLTLLLRWPIETIAWAGIGALGPVAAQSGVLWWVTGSPLPVQLHKSWYLYPGAYWRNPLGLDALNEPKPVYFFHMTLGRFGMFLLFPALLFAVPGAVRSLWVGGPARPATLLVMLATAILFAYYVTSTNNYGGAAYGFRWGIGAMPLCAALAAPAFAQMRHPLAWLLFAACFLLGAYSAWECLHTPWGANHEWTCRWVFGPAY